MSDIKIEYISFRELLYEDLTFLNNVRNTYAEEFLHDSRLFSIEETKKWFINNTNNYLIILYENVKIGYIRLSNYSTINNNIMVGVDISPEFVNRGYGTVAYKKLIPYLFEKYSLNKISLEVLSTNTRAIHLYQKLGFKIDGVKREEVKKNNKYIDSIVMSILKSEYE